MTIDAVLDKSNQTAKYSAATFLANQGVPVLIDDKHAIAHNKIILIDDNVIISGSFNFSNAAETKNAENLLVIRNYPDLFKKYLDNFNAHKTHSVPYARAAADPPADKKGAVQDKGAGKAEGGASAVFVAGDGKRYHMEDCQYVAGRADKVKLTLEEAKRQGYTPCKVCKPPDVSDTDSEER